MDPRINYSNFSDCFYYPQEEDIVDQHQMLKDESTVKELVNNCYAREQLVMINERLKLKFPVEGQDTVNRINQLISDHYFQENILGEIFNYCASMPSEFCNFDSVLTDTSRVCKTWKKAAYLCAKRRMVEAPFLYKCSWSHNSVDSEIEFAGKHQLLGLDLTKYDDLEDRHLKELNDRVKNLCCLELSHAEEITDWPAMLSLKYLKLGGYLSTKICADIAAKCTKLQNIYLLASYITNDGIKELAKCINLEEINLQAVKVSEIGPFANSLKLRKINLLGTLVTDKELSALANSESLEEINLEKTKVGNDGISSLSLCKNLRKLNLAHTNSYDAAFISLSKSTSLEELDISETFVTDTGLSALAKCPTLKKLRFRGSTGRPKVTAEGISSLALSSLQVVSFIFLRLGHAGFKGLSNINTIRKIDLTNSEVDDESLFALAGCKNLQLLKLACYNNCHTEEGISALSKIKTLRKFIYLGDNFNDKAAQAFSLCESLKVLHVRSDLTDVGVKALGTSKTLFDLFLSKSSKVTDVGVLALINCKNLSRLTLSSTKVRIEGILALARIKNNLLLIQIEGTQFDGKEISELIKIIANERPNLKISIRDY